MLFYFIIYAKHKLRRGEVSLKMGLYFKSPCELSVKM